MDPRREMEGAQPSRRRRGVRGFTLLEMMTTVAIVGIVAALAYSSYDRDRPRKALSSTADEIVNAIKSARTRALGYGRDTAVLFYPAQVTRSGTGRVVVYHDLDGGFMQGAAPPGLPSFCDFDSATLPNNRRIMEQIDLPRPVLLTVPANLVPITFPYTTVPFPVTGCSFCAAGAPILDSTGVARMAPGAGAIRFDARGGASFYSTCGPAPAVNTGGSISLTAPGTSGVSGTYVLVVTPSGIVRIFNAG